MFVALIHEEEATCFTHDGGVEGAPFWQGNQNCFDVVWFHYTDTNTHTHMYDIHSRI